MALDETWRRMVIIRIMIGMFVFYLGIKYKNKDYNILNELPQSSDRYWQAAFQIQIAIHTPITMEKALEHSKKQPLIHLSGYIEIIGVQKQHEIKSIHIVSLS